MMMAGTVYLVATGEVLWTVEGDAAQLAAQAGDGREVLEGAVDGRTHWIEGSAAVARPVLELPAEQALAAGEVWSIAGVPEGTGVRIDGTAYEDADPEPGLQISFLVAGVYELRLAPPWPWVEPAPCRVTVS